MQVQTYLYFDGRCEEAIEFYKKTLGAEVVMLMRFKESPDQSMISPGIGEKVMHGEIRIGETRVMLSDGRCQNKEKFQGFALSISSGSDAEAEKLFKALSDGGQVTMPLTKTFFASKFGMCADKFGLNWMILAGQK
ncbi:MAG TPA: VOC family protein [Planctomycetota bacterium]|nr:VOC family protein [Planctomycetota bacterium]